MNPFIKFVAICLAIIVGVYVIYTISFPTYDVRYRLTLYLEVDGKQLESSGVVETTYQVGTDTFVSLGSGGTLGGKFKGNAITIDLGPKGLIFVVNYPSEARSQKAGQMRLIRPHSTLLTNLPFEVFGLPTSSQPSRRGWLISRLFEHSGPIEVPLDELPMLVRFRDIEDNATSEEVNPDDLASTYGAGVNLLRATLELTKVGKGPLPANWPQWLVTTKQPILTVHYGGGQAYVSLGTYPFKGE